MYALVVTVAQDKLIKSVKAELATASAHQASALSRLEPSSDGVRTEVRAAGERIGRLEEVRSPSSLFPFTVLYADLPRCMRTDSHEGHRFATSTRPNPYSSPCQSSRTVSSPTCSSSASSASRSTPNSSTTDILPHLEPTHTHRADHRSRHSSCRRSV
jgi:hypothetical protein